jgi:hypothetical protein
LNRSGNNNTCVGYYAGKGNKGNDNTVVGYLAGWKNSDGYENIFLGHEAGYWNRSGHSNTFLGIRAGYANKSAFGNTFLGHRAGYSNSAGNLNVFLGYLAGYHETGSNKLYIANSDTDKPLIYGDFYQRILSINGKVGIGTMVYSGSPPLQMASGAHVTAGGVWTNASSREYKDDIEALDTKEALDTLHMLHPVKFAYKADRTEQHVGFIAEDVPDLVATKNRKGLSPMDIVAVLTKVVQEQQDMMKQQEKTIQELSAEVKELKRELKSREVARDIDSRR